MKRNLYLMFMLVLVLALSSISAVFAQDGQEESLFRVEVRNRTDQPVTLTLTGKDVSATYLLSVPSGVDRVFTVETGSYDQTTIACGESATGTLRVTHQLRLTFTPCFKNAPNSGAPTIEKVHLTDAPKGIKWFYRYNPTPRAAAATPPAGGMAGACQLRARDEVAIYRRPSTASGVFATVGPGFTISLQARTADGWLGFDPGIAQAANIGSFRLRWVSPDTETLSGACSSLPVVWGPPPGICFDMPMENTQVLANPDASSPAVALLHVGEFAAVTGLAPGGDWAKVDLGPGNTGSTAMGWVEANALNVNGPCDSLPTVSP